MSDPLQDGAWAGEPCLLVGGGPSAADWPVVAHYDYYGAHVIGINGAARDAEVAYVEDKRVLSVFGAWPARRVFHAVESNLPDLSGWQVLGDTGRKWSRSLDDGLVHASNAGVSALNLACILGADPIYLIGFDLVPAEDGKTQNFHGDYPEEWRQPGRVYQRFIEDFERYAPMAKAGGRRIVNLNPASALTCFEKIVP